MRLIPKRLYLFFSHFGKDVHVDPSCMIAPKATLRVSPPGAGSIKIGRNFWMEDHAKLVTHYGNIRIGENCSLNDFSIIRGEVTIGNGVRIGPHCSIIAAGHNFNRIDIPIYMQGAQRKPIRIEDDVWIGAGSCIIGGVIIGKGCVLGAGSIVTQSIPPYSIAFGNPARVTKKRGDEKVSQADSPH